MSVSSTVVAAFTMALVALAAQIEAAEAGGTRIPPPAIAEPTPEELDRLRAGAVVVRDLRLGESGGGALSYAIYHTDIRTLWNTIGDCDANLRFVRGLRECEVVEQDVRRALTRQRLKPYALLPVLDYRFETAREPYDWIEIRLVDGDLRALEGSWRFRPLDQAGTWLVTHRIHVRTFFPAPRWLIRKTVSQDVGDLMACLRWELRAWPDPRQRGLDRQRCPD